MGRFDERRRKNKEGGGGALALRCLPAVQTKSRLMTDVKALPRRAAKAFKGKRVSTSLAKNLIFKPAPRHYDGKEKRLPYFI